MVNSLASLTTKDVDFDYTQSNIVSLLLEKLLRIGFVEIRPLHFSAGLRSAIFTGVKLTYHGVVSSPSVPPWHPCCQTSSDLVPIGTVE
jgi:hypothetical protein